MAQHRRTRAERDGPDCGLDAAHPDFGHRHRRVKGHRGVRPRRRGRLETGGGGDQLHRPGVAASRLGTWHAAQVRAGTQRSSRRTVRRAGGNEVDGRAGPGRRDSRHRATPVGEAAAEAEIRDVVPARAREPAGAVRAPVVAEIGDRGVALLDPDRGRSQHGPEDRPGHRDVALERRHLVLEGAPYDGERPGVLPCSDDVVLERGVAHDRAPALGVDAGVPPSVEDAAGDRRRPVGDPDSGRVVGLGVLGGVVEERLVGAERGPPASEPRTTSASAFRTWVRTRTRCLRSSEIWAAGMSIVRAALTAVLHGGVGQGRPSPTRPAGCIRSGRGRRGRPSDCRTRRRARRRTARHHAGPTRTWCRTRPRARTRRGWSRR